MINMSNDRHVADVMLLVHHIPELFHSELHHLEHTQLYILSIETICISNTAQTKYDQIIQLLH